jgi:hypothetical protein
MGDVSDTLRNRFDHIDVIVDIAESYLELTKDIVAGLNSTEFNNVKSAIEFLKKSTSATDAKYVTLTQLTDLYDNLVIVDGSLIILNKFIENTTYMKMATYNMSATYNLEVQRGHGRARAAYNLYKTITLDDDERIFTSVISSLDVKKRPDDAYRFIIENSSKINKFTTALTGVLIEVCPIARHRSLELIIEKQRDQVLESQRVDISELIGVSGQLLRYNMKPITSSLKLIDLFKVLEVKYKSETTVEANFKALMDTHTGVIVLNKASPSPIEFDIRGLIDEQFVIERNLKTNPVGGLNKKVLERFNTTRFLGRTSVNPTAAIKYANGTPSTWYVFETINGELYRVLSTSDAFTVPADLIIGLLHGVSTRASQYNNLHYLDSILDPNGPLIVSQYVDEKQHVASSDPIKQHVVDQMTEYFKQLIKINPVKNAIQLRTSVGSAPMITAITKIISANLTHNTKHAGAFGKGSTEYTLTHVLRVNSVTTSYIKELDRKWSNEIIEDRIFKEKTPDDLQTYIIERFTYLAGLAADELDAETKWVNYDISVKEYFLDRKDVLL